MSWDSLLSVSSCSTMNGMRRSMCFAPESMVIFAVWLPMLSREGVIVYVYVVSSPAPISCAAVMTWSRRSTVASTVYISLPVFFIVIVITCSMSGCMISGMIIDLISSLGVSFISIVVVSVFVFDAGLLPEYVVDIDNPPFVSIMVFCSLSYMWQFPVLFAIAYACMVYWPTE